jgi:predicted TIM-barrel fold metal-dependent hydrolase
MRAKPNNCDGDAQPDLRALRLFDACVTLGRLVHSGDEPSVPTAAVHSGYPQCLTRENIRETLDRYCIAEALVQEHHARVATPRDFGNRLLIEEIRGIPGLHPVWVVVPPLEPGRAPAEALVETMLGAGVRVARLLLRAAPPLPWLWEDLFQVLEAHRVPCLLDAGDVATIGAFTDSDLAGLHELATRHPALPMVFSHAMGGLGVHPALVPLLCRTRNLHLDITGVLDYWGDAARVAGPERVLFATGAPFTDPGIYVSNVQYAPGWSEEAKRLICGDNLRRLLEAVR